MDKEFLLELFSFIVAWFLVCSIFAFGVIYPIAYDDPKFCEGPRHKINYIVPIKAIGCWLAEDIGK